MTNHVRDFQILYDDEIGSLDEPSGLRMKPAITGVRDLSVHPCHLHTHFVAAMTASLAAGERTLHSAKFRFGSSCNARIWDRHVVAAIGEYLKS
jgi:hypothetical protein